MLDEDDAASVTGVGAGGINLVTNPSNSSPSGPPLVLFFRVVPAKSNRSSSGVFPLTNSMQLGRTSIASLSFVL